MKIYFSPNIPLKGPKGQGCPFFMGEWTLCPEVLVERSVGDVEVLKTSSVSCLRDGNSSTDKAFSVHNRLSYVLSFNFVWEVGDWVLRFLKGRSGKVSGVSEGYSGYVLNNGHF